MARNDSFREACMWFWLSEICDVMCVRGKNLKNVSFLSDIGLTDGNIKLATF
jgi:hypothetical protein